MSHTYGWSSLLLRGGATPCVSVGCGSSETWLQSSDALTHVYAHLHTPTHFYLAAWWIVASLGVLEEVQKNHFSFKDFFFPAGLFIIVNTGLIPVYHFFTTAVLASSSHHLISLRWQRSRHPRVDTVTNPTFPQAASLSESSGDHIKRFPFFTLLLLLRFVFISQGLNNSRRAVCFLRGQIKTLRCLSA